MLVRTIPSFLLVFLTLIYKVSCQGASLTFVIDDTRSMGDDIAQVRRNVDSIMDIVLDEKSSQISNIVLVTFNDPAVRLRKITRTRQEFKAAMARVKVHNYFNYDCPEMALSGIKLAIESSLPGSYIYVFTDASAKDYHLSEEIQQLCQRKQSQVVFVLTGDCKLPNSKRFKVYYDIATASSGLAFRVRKNEVDAVVHTIRETIKGNKTVLTTRVTPPDEYTDVPFWIDDQTEYAIISASGTDVSLRIKGPSGSPLDTEKIMWTRNGKVLKIKKPDSGKYVATVKGSSSTSVVITGRSDFLFRHGFSEQEPKVIDDTASQPLSETLTHLSFLVTDPKHSVQIKSAEILDMKENVIKTFTVKELSPDFYVTEPFAAPSDMFKVALIGEAVQTGKPVRRIAKIPVTPQKAPPGKTLAKVPVVEIKEGASVEVARGSSLTLTCKVSAYPEPEITWTNDKGITVQSTSSRVQIPYDYISYLKISKTSEGTTYHCNAKNILMKVVKDINVKTKDPITVKTIPKGTTKVGYGTDSTLNCDVTSPLPLLIQWYHVNKATGETDHVISSNKYSVSSDGKQLKITSMDVDMVGKYTCKASVIGDPNEKKEFSTNVEIDGLVAPKIKADTKNVQVRENTPVTIKCNILKATPKPTITWQFKAPDTNSYQIIPGSGAELRFPTAGLHNAGSYRCIASNVEGRDEHTVAELVVVKAPAVTVKEGTDITVQYGSPLTLTCKVTAHPPPTISWTDSQGKSLLASISGTKNEFEYSYKAISIKESGKFKCRAENNQGSKTESIQVTVLPAFKVLSHPPNSIVIPYGNHGDLKCDIKSNLPMKIEWYYASDSTKAGSTLSSSDKAYETSPDGTLKIKSMDIDLSGVYTCKATLINDPTVTKSFTTKINIGGLVSPKIKPDTKQVTAKEHTLATIQCNIIKAVPKPKITWEFKASSTNSYKMIPGSGAELEIPNAGLHNTGSYRCIASNVEGRDEQTVAELVVVKVPSVTIEEGVDITVQYGSPLNLTCKVTAHPPPTISWTDSQGKPLLASISGTKNEFEYTYKAISIKESGKFKCLAENNQGSETESIQVTVLPAFKVLSHPPDAIEIPYGNRVDLKCDITSNLPMKIEWYYASDSTKAGSKLISPNKAYETSADGTLKIKSMDMNVPGIYTCKATLIADPTVTKSFTTKINIGGLVPPQIDPLPIKLNIIETNPTVITCKVLRGVPKPNISWQMKATDSSEYRSIAGSGSELRIEQASLANGGQYKCIAENAAGRREQVVAELVVLKAPAVAIVEGASMEVTYGSQVTLECRVTANPKPAVVWKDGAGNTLPAMGTAVKSGFVYTHILTRANVKESDNFSCSAVNEQGSNIQNIQVSVSSPFKVRSHPSDSTPAKYGNEVILRCDISSNAPVKIRWYYRKDSTSDRKEIETSKQYTILSNGAELKINTMDIDLVGNYACKASLQENPDESVEFATDVKIDGLELPKVTGNGNQKVKVGASVSIKCNVVKGVPKPILSWQFKASNSAKYEDMNNFGNEWHITNATVKDSGYYTCTARNSLGSGVHIFALTVEEPAKITTDDNSVYEGIIGDIALRIPCEAVGSPQPTFEWKVNNAVVTLGSKYAIEDGALIISHPERSDNNYTCTATNSAGSDTKTFRGVVDDILSDYGTIHDVYILEGDTKDVTCNLPRSESSTIKWFIEPQGTRSDKPLVTVEKAKLEDDGNYTCHVSDIHGSATETYVVDVGYPPKFQFPQDELVEWSGDTEDVLSCSVLAKPNADIEWSFNGEPLTHESSFQLNILKWGQYKCNVSNVHGSVQRAFEVKPTVCLISRNKEDAVHAPLMLTEELSWPDFQTSGEYMIMKPGDNLMLSCHNQEKSPNSFQKFPALTELVASCDKGDTFIVDGKPRQLKDLQCTNEIYPSVEKTGIKCLTETSELMRVGYKLNDFLEAYEVCFDHAKNIPLFTRVLMSKTNDRPSAFNKWFKYPGIGNSTDDVYTCETSSSTCCYAKTQLTSATDLSYGAAQKSSLIYPLNAVPQWRPCDKNKKTWENLEKMVRAQLDINPNFVVWSGTHTLQEKNGGVIPRYLWKVIRESEDDSIAIVHVNDASPTAADIKCSDSCADRVPWFTTSDSYTYCCTVADFITAFGIPGSVVGESLDIMYDDQISTINQSPMIT